MQKRLTRSFPIRRPRAIVGAHPIPVERPIRNRILKVLILCLAVLVLGFLIQRAWFFLRYGSLPAEGLGAAKLDIDQGFPFPAGFPPDPGSSGKRDLTGIDSDRDGVRDDVQRWIHALYPKDVAKRNSLRQWARYFQDFLDKDFGVGIRQATTRAAFRAADCEAESFLDNQQSYNDVSYLEAKVMNTKDRTVQYLENNWKVTTEEMAGDHPYEDRPCDGF